MSVELICLIVFVCAFGGAIVGMTLRAALPEHHLSHESRDVVKVGMGLVGTMSALLLGLLVASAKGSYDTDKGEVTQMSAKILFLDRVLATYGPEAQPTREALRRAVAVAVERMWPEEGAAGELDPSRLGVESLFHAISQMPASTDEQRTLKSQALSLASDIGQTRWLLFEQGGRSISRVMLMMVVFWLTIIFVSFGLQAPRNATVMCTLALCALSVAGAMFLVLELDHPFDGLIRIPSDAMRSALQHLGG